MAATTRRLVAVLCLVAFAGVAQAQGYRRYENARYGTRIDVPAGYLADPAPENNDGRTFRSRDGTVEIAVFGSHGPSVATGTFAEYRDWTASNQDGRITYRAGGADWFVLSGIAADRIFYIRVVAGCSDRSIGHHVRITYPLARQRALDATVRRVAGSLAFTDTGECGDDMSGPARPDPPPTPPPAVTAPAGEPE